MNNNNAGIVIITLAALMVQGILVHENSRLDRNTKKKFYRTLVAIIIATIAEWVGLLLNGAPEEIRGIHALVKCIDYILTPTVGVLFAAQVVTDRRMMSWAMPVLGANAALQIMSIFTGWTFYLDEKNYYFHGPLYVVYIAIYLMAIGFVVWGFISYGRSYKRRNLVSLLAIVATVVLGIILQEAFKLRVCYLSIAVGSILLFIHYNEFTQLRQDEDLIQREQLLETDILTGLYSRYAYTQMLQRYEEKPALPSDLAVFSMDVNELKSTNDTMGHEAGDELIRGAASCIKEALSTHGRCYRTGGDEFIAILIAKPEQIPALQARLTAETQRWHGKLVSTMSLSQGVAVSGDHPNLPIEKLIGLADAEMYRAKSAYYQTSGKDRRKN